MIKMSHTMNSSNQILMNNDKLVVNSVSSNKRVLSSEDLGSRKKIKKAVKTAQPSQQLLQLQHQQTLQKKNPKVQILSLTDTTKSSSMVSAVEENSTAYTYTVLQQGSQQLLIPASYLKCTQGLQLIPLPQNSNAEGRPQK